MRIVHDGHAVGSLKRGDQRQAGDVQIEVPARRDQPRPVHAGGEVRARDPLRVAVARVPNR